MPSITGKLRTLYDKVFESHIVDERSDGTVTLYCDRHLVHEVSSPQAFEGLRHAGRRVRRPDNTLVTVDHNVPTTSRKNYKTIETFIKEESSRLQCATLEENVKDFGLTYFGLGDKRQGIVHVIGPEQGFTLPGTTIVCGDSHTATHGAFGALAFGIGTSEVEHVLATQCLVTKRSQNMRISVNGKLIPGVGSKDIILHVIGVIGTAGGTGTVIEYCGSTIKGLSMEARMSLCNMTIEAGARAGLIAADQTTFDYLKGRPLAPKGKEWGEATRYWTSLASDEGALYDKEIFLDAKDITPTVTWGTSPEHVVPITSVIPNPKDFVGSKRHSIESALNYMGLIPGTRMEDIQIDKVFIGSCTNARIEDLRAAAQIICGRKIASNIKRAMVVPGSGLVKACAEAEGLNQIFLDAGFEWREAGCSMCVGMNADFLEPFERCASTSNRNFEGRQGARGRTHLLSPIMAAAAAISGKLSDVRCFLDLSSMSTLKVEMSYEVENVCDASTIESSTDCDSESDGEQKNLGKQECSTVSAIPPLRSLEPSWLKFTTLKGIAAPVDRSNIDTDLLVPKQFLKGIKRTGLGSALFFPIRYNSDGLEIATFVLNQEPYRHAKILVVTGPNFGCGSSREHAPWALLDFGIKAVIAPSFAEILYNNMFKNGMLPVIINDKEKLEMIAEEARAGHEIEVDLVNEAVKDSDGKVLAEFKVEEFHRHCLIEGLDEIELTLAMEDQIKMYENRRTLQMPWLDGSGYMRRKRLGANKVAAVPLPKPSQNGNKMMQW